MTKRQWIFPAISCIPLSMILVRQYLWIGILLYLIWFVRILFLKHKETIKTTIIIGLLFCGVLIYHQTTNNTSLNIRQKQLIVYPELTSIQIDGDQLRFEGKVIEKDKMETIVVNYRMETKSEKNLWENSTSTYHLLIAGDLQEPAENSNFHQFNYRAYLKRQNIHWQLKATNIQSLEDAELPKPTFYFIEKIRHNLFEYIDKTFQPKLASYLKILLFADKRGFSTSLLQNYREIGIVHLFSISGFHITYLGNFIRRLLLRLGLTHERTNGWLLLILPMYGVLAGFGVSVFRAVVQSSILTIARIKRVRIPTIDAWALTMILALFVNPYQVFDISFQLSYLLSAMFILLGNQEWLQELHPLLHSLLFSLMGGLASLPILAFHFFEVSWVTVFANLLFIPFFTYILFPALLFLFGSSLFIRHLIVFPIFNHFITAVIEGIEDVLMYLNSQFDFSVVIGRLPPVIMGIMIWSLFHLLKRLEAKRLPSLITLSLFLVSIFYYQLSPVGYILMLDIGQGDSILIKEPQTGKVTLIDTGGRAEWYAKDSWQLQEDPFSIGKDITVPALKSLGISTIDRMYLTHADADHTGEIKSIGQSIQINEIASTKETLKDQAVSEQLSTLKNTELTVIQAPTVLDYPTRSTLALHPITRTKNNNNDSLTLYVRIGNDTWLFTGDLEEEAERTLINTYPNLKSDYLKVAHHGSKTSTSPLFLNQIQAKSAFISAGRENQFGHPNEEIINRLQRMNIQIYNTAEHGAVMVKYMKLPFIDYWLTDIQTVLKN